MSKIGLAITDVAEAETELAALLWRVGERHTTDHDVHHMTKTLAKLCESHVETLARVGGAYSAEVEAGPAGDAASGDGLRDTLREKGAELLGRRPEPGMLLLYDLRAVYLAAARASIGWVALGQAAQAIRDRNLLTAVDGCHAESLRILRWANYRIKEAAPQALAA